MKVDLFELIWDKKYIYRVYADGLSSFDPEQRIIILHDLMEKLKTPEVKLAYKEAFEAMLQEELEKERFQRRRLLEIAQDVFKRLVHMNMLEDLIELKMGEKQ